MPPPAQHPSMEISLPREPHLFGINMAVYSVTLLICLCGLAGNGAVLCLLGPSIRSKAITVYIFHMAITDFAYLLLNVASTVLLLVHEMFFSITVPWQVLILLSLPLYFSYVLGLYLLTAISFNRCRSTLCPLCCRCHHPQKQSKVVSAMLWATSTAVIPTLTSLFVSDNTQRFLVTVLVLLTLNLLLFASSMVISSTFFFVKVMRGCQQQPLERLDIVIFLMVLFGLPSGICIFLFLFKVITYEPVLYLLISIHLSVKPFIYMLLGRCWKHRSVGSLQLSLQRLFGEPEETTACSNDDTTVSEV